MLKKISELLVILLCIALLLSACKGSPMELEENIPLASEPESAQDSPVSDTTQESQSSENDTSVTNNSITNVCYAPSQFCLLFFVEP